MKKKVAFFTNGLYGGGAEKILQNILRFLDKNKYDITLYSVQAAKIKGEYPSDIEYRTVYKSTEGKSWLGRFLTLLYNKVAYTVYSYFSPSLFYSLFVHGKYDVEIAFIEGYATRIVAGSTNPHNRKLAWVHIDLSVNHWTQIAYHSDDEECSCYRKFDSVVAVSDYVRQVNDRIFPDIKDSCYIYNPVDYDEIVAKGGKKVQIQHDYIRIVSSGRFTHQKSFDRLLHIVKRLQEERYSIELWLLGDGQMRTELETYIYENNLQDVVTLYGFQKNPYRLMKQCDLFVCSSLTEGFSTVITEALILGLPVVSTEVSGIREQLGKNGEYGIITENNEDALYLGIKFLLDNPDKLVYFRDKALERRKIFKTDSMMSAVVNKIG